MAIRETGARDSILALTLAMHLPGGTPEDPFAGIDERYRPIAQAILEEHDPATPTEAIVVSQLILNGLQMHQGVQPVRDDADGHPLFRAEAQQRQRQQGSREFRAHLGLLNRLRKADDRVAKPHSTKPVKPAPPEFPPRPFETPEQVEAAAQNWRSLIALVPAYDEFPVVLRNGRLVEHVMMLAASSDYTDEKVLNEYPDLWQSELAACRACEAEGLQGPFNKHRPYPPGLPRIEGANGDALAEYFRTCPRAPMQVDLHLMPPAWYPSR